MRDGVGKGWGVHAMAWIRRVFLWIERGLVFCDLQFVPRLLP